MEGAAIAWVAEMHRVPFFSIKVITDIVDGSRPTEEEFLENLHHAAQSLESALPKVIDFVAGKSLRQLQ
jgi:5'-methylthioadenosine nucleosidase